MAEVEAPECFWYLLIHIDGEAPDLRKFRDVGSLRNEIMRAWPEIKLLNDDVAFYIFFGVRAKITKGHQPCLLHPDGTLIPLYDVDEPVELSDDGVVNQREVPAVTEEEYVEEETTPWEQVELDDEDITLGDGDGDDEEEPFPEGEVSEEEPV